MKIPDQIITITIIIIIIMTSDDKRDLSMLFIVK